jgi:hypothetical protein
VGDFTLTHNFIVGLRLNEPLWVATNAGRTITDRGFTNLFQVGRNINHVTYLVSKIVSAKCCRTRGFST